MRSLTSRIAFLTTMVCCVLTAAAGRAESFRIGTARVDITPNESIRMSGYASREKPSEGVEQKLFAKALVIEDSTGARNVLVTADILSFPGTFTEPLADRLHKELGIARERFMLVPSHTHTGPVVYRPDRPHSRLAEREVEVIRSNTERMSGQLFELVKQAAGELQPARLAFGRGQAHFAANRRVFRPDGVKFGVNPDGVVDPDVPVLRVETAEGDVRAIVFGYACHCTTLTGDYYRICGDWASYAQEYIELAYPGAQAMFVTGCGGDANPEPRGKLEYARHHGLHLAGSVAAALSRPMADLPGAIRAGFDRVDLPFEKLPSREEFEQRLQDKNQTVRRHAEYILEKLDRKEPLPESYSAPLQVWQFGNELTLIALSGEVVVDYCLRLKRELGAERLWVAGYANDVYAYIPSVRILHEGGYEADTSAMGYGLPNRFAPVVEEKLMEAVHQLVRRTREDR